MGAFFRERFVGGFALLLSFLLGLAPQVDLVLCFEPDGSIALETGDQPTCSSVGSAEAPRAPTFESQRSPCCACVDVRIEGQDEERLVVKEPVRVVGSASYLAPAVSELFRLPIPVPPRAATSTRIGVRAPPHLVSLRTDVLRV